MAALANLSKWALKSSAKFASLGRTGVFPRNREGAVLGSMPWMSWAEASAPKESYALAKRVLCLRYFWRRFKVSFQAFHVWSPFGFPYHSRKLLGNELTRRREDVVKAVRQLSVIGWLERLAFFCASSIVIMN